MGKVKYPPVKPGDVYGRWKVVEKASTHPFRWTCVCACGLRRDVLDAALKNGASASCGKTGCRETAGNPTHCLSKDPLYRTWNSIKQRCLNPNAVGYEFYGGRGIEMHEGWVDDAEAFIVYVKETLGERPHKLTLDRIDNDGPYGPGNLRWASRTEQARNTRNNHFVEVDGEMLCLVDAARRLGIPPATVGVRIHRGQTPEQALGLENA